MTTIRDLVTRSLRKINAIGQGAVLQAEEAEDARVLLNAMLQAWSAEGSLVPAETKETFNLTTATTYTIGPSADFNTVRPLDIKSAYVSDGQTDYHLFKYGNAEYSAISSKSITSGIPDIFYYDNDNPTATLYLYPAPSGVQTITLNTIKPLTSITSLDQDFDLPDHFEIGVIYNLAVFIAPEYEKEASPTVKEVAHWGKGIIEAQTERNVQNWSDIDTPERNDYDYNVFEGNG